MACPFCSGKKKEYMNYGSRSGEIGDVVAKMMSAMMPEIAKLYSKPSAPKRSGGHFQIYKHPNMVYMYDPWTNEMEVFHDTGDTETFYSNTERPGMLLQSLYMGSRRGLGDANAAGMSYPINGAAK